MKKMNVCVLFGGVSKAATREALCNALLEAAKYDDKILVEEFVHGREIEVAASGIAYVELIDNLLRLAMEAKR